MDNLQELQDELKNEQQRLENRLNEIQDELDSITKVLQLIENRKKKKDDKQMSLITEDQSTEYADMTFKGAVLDLFEKNPERIWRPKQITKALLNKGFKTKSKNFGNITRAMLLNFREEGIIYAEKVQDGKQEVWQYSHKKQEPLSPKE